MQIIYHIGANCTDGERLLKSIMRNVESLAARKTAVPGPGKYRTLLRETMQKLGGQTPATGTRDVLIDAILDDQETDRLILSNSTFLSLPPRVFDGGQFYGKVEPKLQMTREMFDGDRISYFLALRNPATFIPAVFRQSKAPNLQRFLFGIGPHEVFWSDLVERIRQHAPEADLTVWCNEDTPLIWTEILRRMTGLDAAVPLAGEHDLLAAIMQPEGFGRFESYMKSHPQPTDIQARRVISSFLDKYAKPEEIEEEVDLPGWTERHIEDLTASYEADVARIAAMNGLTFVAP